MADRSSEGSCTQASEAILGRMAERFRREVEQANELLEWALASGKRVDDTVVQRIKGGRELIGEGLPEVGSRAAFESAYGRLTRIIAPVTFATYAATSDDYGRRHWLAAPLRAVRNWKWVRKLFHLQPEMAPATISRAAIWSRVLWAWTVVLLALVLLGENLRGYMDTFLPVDEESVASGRSSWWLERGVFWFEKVVPFLYGALGSCAYLLRSCHRFIHERTFDPQRIPEYYNRVLLGFLAGGAILLFITPASAPQKISASALAFLAGYSTDFLFTTIERVAAALLPKKVAETPPAGQGQGQGQGQKQEQAGQEE